MSGLTGGQIVRIPINAAVTLNCHYYSVYSKHTHQCLCDYIFLPHSYIFVLNLRESLIKLLRDNGQKDFKIHIEVPENY